MINCEDGREKRGYYLPYNLVELDECEKGQKDPDGKLSFSSETFTRGMVYKGIMQFQSQCKGGNDAVRISRQK